MSWKSEKDKLAKEIICSLYNVGMIKTWYREKSEGWVLVSGLWSPFYIQLRPLCSHPDILRKVGYAMGKMIRNEASHVNKIVGIAMAGIPIATAITICEGIPSAFTRKIEGVTSFDNFCTVIEKYGEHSLLEGDISENDNIMIVDDLVTKFDSKLITIEQVKYESKKRGVSIVTCKDVAVLFDREQGALETAIEYKISLHSLIPFKTKGLNWLKRDMSDFEHHIIVDYLEDPQRYQDLNFRKKILIYTS